MATATTTTTKKGLLAAAAPAQRGLLGSLQDGLGGFGAKLTEMREENPEAFLALGAGLLQGDMGLGVAGMGNAIGAFRQNQRQTALQRESWDRDERMQQAGWARDDARQAQTFARQDALLNEERAQRRALGTTTSKFLAAQGAPPEVVSMAEAGNGQAALDLWKASRNPYGEPTASMREYRLAQDDPGFAAYQDRGGGAAGGGRAPSGYRWSQDGASLEPIPGGPASTGAPGGAGGAGAGMKLTEQQSKDLNYVQRGQAALATIEKGEAALSSAYERGAGSAPLVGNYLTSDDYQVANQAGREFLAAILRKDTGAAITSQEFEIYGPMFLPQPGDGKAVLDQKRAARTRAMEAMRLGLGTATPLADAPVTQNPTRGEGAADPLGIR